MKTIYILLILASTAFSQITPPPASNPTQSGTTGFNVLSSSGTAALTVNGASTLYVNGAPISASVNGLDITPNTVNATSTSGSSNSFTTTITSTNSTLGGIFNLNGTWNPTAPTTNGYYGMYLGAFKSGTTNLAAADQFLGARIESVNIGSGTMYGVTGLQVRSGLGVGGSGNVGTAISLDVMAPDSSGTAQPITTVMGIRINSQSGAGITNNYAIQQIGTTDTVSLQGNVAIGGGVSILAAPNKLAVTNSPTQTGSNYSTAAFTTTYTPALADTTFGYLGFANNFVLAGTSSRAGTGRDAAVSVQAYAQGYSGTTSDLEGIYIQGGNNGSTGRVLSYDAIHIASPFHGNGGTIHNSNGIVIETLLGSGIDQGSAINQIGTSDPSFFAGPVTFSNSGGLTVSGGSLLLTAVGKTVSIKGGSNALSGTLVLSSGVVSVVSTAITTSMDITLTRVGFVSLTGFTAPLTAVGSGSFEVQGAATDSGTYNWHATLINQ